MKLFSWFYSHVASRMCQDSFRRLLYAPFATRWAQFARRSACSLASVMFQDLFLERECGHTEGRVKVFKSAGALGIVILRAFLHPLL